jgi:hypothetical protein
MKLLEKLKAAAQTELNCCKVEVPELGTCYVAELSGVEADKFGDWWLQFKEDEDLKHNDDFRRAAVAFCLCDEDRKLECETQEDFAKCVKALRKLPASVTSTLFNPADQLNGFLGVDPTVKKLLLEAVKKAKNDDGNGELPLVKDSQAEYSGSHS